MSLRLKQTSVEIDGVKYPLRCNMAVLERLQDGPGKGEIGGMMQIPTYQAVFEILKAMLDDACEDDESLPVITMRKLKKTFSPADLGELGIFRMFVDSLTVVQQPSGTPNAETGPMSGSDTAENNEPGTPGN